MDTLAAFQTILAIPGALQSIRELTTLLGPHKETIDKDIDLIKNALLSFSFSAKWFSDAKEYHDVLTNLDIGMQDLVHLAMEPSNEGGFNADRFDTRKFILTWRSIRSNHFLRV